MNKKELSHIFKKISTIYRYKGGQDRFRAAAYQKAAGIIDSLTEDISFYIKNNSLEKLPGIGESIAAKIREFYLTRKINKYEQLQKEVPDDLINMLDISGFGPQTIKQLHKNLNITNKEELIRALKDGSVNKIKGFGKKKAANMLRGINLHQTVEDRMLLWDALEAGENLINWLKEIPQVHKIELAGSLRRRKETIGDIDILASCERKDRGRIMNHFTSPEISERILAKGLTKSSVILKKSNRQADIRIVDDAEWGSALQYFTGSKAHNIHLRTIAKERGYKISEYGVFKTENNKRIICKNEEDVYHGLGFECMPPEMREDEGEIELAEKNKIPKLVSLKDIKGDLHMHSTWSDGINTIEEMALYAKNILHYKYIALTDHSQSSRIANGMNEKTILKQLKKIEQVNKTLGEDFIKKGVEVDILADGSLDFSDEILSQLDWVTAAIHSSINRNNTSRIISACLNPYVHCIGHPTGRLIGSRQPSPLDFEKVFQVAKETGTALEINAQPNRMDLNDSLTMSARKEGVMLVINTDAHSTGNLHYMKLGVDIAKRAWCEPKNILNCRNWNEIKKFTQRKLNRLAEPA